MSYSKTEILAAQLEATRKEGERAVATFRDRLSDTDPGYALQHSGSVFLAVAEGEVAARAAMLLEKGPGLAFQYALDRVVNDRSGAVGGSTSVMANVLDAARHSAWCKVLELLRPLVEVSAEVTK